MPAAGPMNIKTRGPVIQCINFNLQPQQMMHDYCTISTAGSCINMPSMPGPVQKEVGKGLSCVSVDHQDGPKQLPGKIDCGPCVHEQTSGL
jgi:hypothetical protein